MLSKVSAEQVRTALAALAEALGPRVDVERLVEAEPMLLLADIQAVRGALGGPAGLPACMTDVEGVWR